MVLTEDGTVETNYDEGARSEDAAHETDAAAPRDVPAFGVLARVCSGWLGARPRSGRSRQ